MTVLLIGAGAVGVVHLLSRALLPDPAAAAILTMPFALLSIVVLSLMWRSAYRRHRRFERRYRP